jgi:hypothetical protein
MRSRGLSRFLFLAFALAGAEASCRRVDAKPPAVPTVPVEPSPTVPAPLTVPNGWRDLKFGMSEEEVEGMIAKFQTSPGAHWQKSAASRVPTVRLAVNTLDLSTASPRFRQWSTANLDDGAGRVWAWFDADGLVAVEVEGKARADVFARKAGEAYGAARRSLMSVRDASGGSQQRDVLIWAGSDATALVWITADVPSLLIWANGPLKRRALEYQAELDAPAVAAKAEEQGAENGTKF